jgi:hypothetical protein
MRNRDAAAVRPGFSGASGCDVHGGNLPREAFGDTLVCERCLGPVPVSAALTSDGADYVWHYCGHDCLAAWCARAQAGRH